MIVVNSVRSWLLSTVAVERQWVPLRPIRSVADWVQGRQQRLLVTCGHRWFDEEAPVWLTQYVMATRAQSQSHYRHFLWDREIFKNTPAKTRHPQVSMKTTPMRSQPWPNNIGLRFSSHGWYWQPPKPSSQIYIRWVKNVLAYCFVVNRAYGSIITHLYLY
jgi:hypothetical protein